MQLITRDWLLFTHNTEATGHFPFHKSKCCFQSHSHIITSGYQRSALKADVFMEEAVVWNEIVSIQGTENTQNTERERERENAIICAKCDTAMFFQTHSNLSISNHIQNASCTFSNSAISYTIWAWIILMWCCLHDWVNITFLYFKLIVHFKAKSCFTEHFNRHEN